MLLAEIRTDAAFLSSAITVIAFTIFLSSAVSTALTLLIVTGGESAA